MGIPKRLARQSGRHALVDGIPFSLPVNSADSPALMAAFPIDADKAAGLMPGNELHPFRLWGNTGLLLITVIDYRVTDIGKYVEFSIAIACTHGRKPAPPILNALFFKFYACRSTRRISISSSTTTRSAASTTWTASSRCALRSSGRRRHR